MSRLKYTQLALEWDVALTYAPTQPANKNGKKYIALTANTGVDPELDTAEVDWLLVGDATVTNLRTFIDTVLPVKSGLLVTPNTNLTIGSAAGAILTRDNAEIVSTPYAAQPVITFDLWNSTGLEAAAQTVVDVDSFDNGGIVTLMAQANDAAIWRLLVHTTLADTFVMLRPQVEYTTFNNAIVALESEEVTLPAGLENYREVSRFAARRDTTNMTVATRARFVASDKFFKVGGSSVEPTVMQGATDLVDGQQGEVPAPLAGDENKFLKGDGTWSSVTLKSLAVESKTASYTTVAGDYTVPPKWIRMSSGTVTLMNPTVDQVGEIVYIRNNTVASMTVGAAAGVTVDGTLNGTAVVSVGKSIGVVAVAVGQYEVVGN